ncbi:cyclin-like protein [Cyathus striatus]|nr:cyclin-like protein [Cyathus striatus]
MTSTNHQWLFPLSALHSTPSTCSLERELYDRARGVEFLYRLGSSLMLPTSAMCTAATWLHRFYMRYPLDDFHRQDVAASCIFLATKTEECGRKLRDVARIYQSKVANVDSSLIAAESKEVDQCQTAILLTEEVLLEALCFDFVVDSPHAELVDLFDVSNTELQVQDYAWSLAHDSYRTPLCILYPPKIIAAACYILAQRMADGPNSPSLDARISASSPSASLPTPPSHKPPSPDASRYAVDHYTFTAPELVSLSDALSILLEFYTAQDEMAYPYLSTITMIIPPSSSHRPRLFIPSPQHSHATNSASISTADEVAGRTPTSSHGGLTPIAATTERKSDVRNGLRIDDCI